MQEQDKKTEQDIAATEAAAAETAQANPELDATADQNAQSKDQLVAELQAKVAELQDVFMRAKAEGENIRRRAQDDIAKAHKFAIEGFAEAMVPVKDSLEMALKVETLSIDSLKEGVEMTLKQLSSAFEKNRLLEVNPLQGEKLDPMKHQAISMVPAEQDVNTVVTVLQKGYMIADRLLRPALVTVAQGK
ncbi:nucleotide exchange factor GrpE [Undibacterium sp. CY7W]|uniref:Protein GrpE n=1 Tax=Undibacterium rugosum TaxID=2762291 RepID=A0A923I3T0_9BURK|nr:nucleotide exchange factor GrpE [Undibacterium rugosum]MBC3935997.1 nucleotide exchange factor GrpE [Undibacterium rugosum]